jgi:hypothetical protein
MRRCAVAEDIATIVDDARVRTFVGRTVELACFSGALGGAAQRVLFVHGAGGLGKTALLHQFRILARTAGRAVASVDGEDVDGSPDGLQAAVQSARRAALRDTPESGRWVLLVDGYERLTAVDSWVRDRLVASLPADVVVVLAGRNAPAPAWRTDPGWRAVVACLPLDRLDPQQSRLLLAHAGVAEDRSGRLADLGRGHPLTLAMLADAAMAYDLPDDLADAPDLVATLAIRLVDEAPDDDHALAMALCAHTWLTTQDLLAELIGRDVPEVWTWLETRPWVTRGTYGIYPHDLVRDVLDADLRRRSPATYRRVHRTVHEHSWTALRSDDESERRLWAHQKLFLHRKSPLAVSFWTLRARGTGLVSSGRQRDHAEAVELVRRSAGTATAELLERWLAAQPEGLSVSRSSTALDAFVFQVLWPADPAGSDQELAEQDPVVATVLEHVAEAAPARPGELVSVARFLGGRTGNQRDPYAVVVGSVSSTMLWTTRPLAWSFVATTDPDFWGPIFNYLALTTVLQVQHDELHYTLYGVDWRRLPPDRWFDLLGERELTGETGPAPAHLLRPAPLSRTGFAEALKSALRDLHRPEQLRSSALIGSRLAMDLDGVSTERLQASLVAGIESIVAGPRSERLGRVLDRTYLHPAPTQEAAAEVLDLPFSTYRRHLMHAVEQLTELLWSVEIGEARLADPRSVAARSKPVGASEPAQ